MSPLLDLPSTQPCMQFPKYAEELAEILKNADPPQMTIGIFGSYGLGKTTLMREIQRKLPHEINNIPTIKIWFNAWRYDHEKNLIIPFLLTVREHLKGYDESSWERIHEACRAFIRGFSFEFGPISFSSKDALEAVKNIKEENTKELEAYTSAYVDIIGYLKELTCDANNNITRRIIVFIDDLDRCFPKRALQLLENIKAFTDIPGFLFVLGLDPRVIKAYLSSKYGDGFHIKGEEYLEKMFQLSFYIPKPSESNMNEVLTVLKEEVSEPLKQLLNDTAIAKYLLHLNIRQVKRLLNTHCFILSISEKPLDPALVFALLVLQSRWPKVYQYLYKLEDKFLNLLLFRLNSPKASASQEEGDSAAMEALEDKEFYEYMRHILVPRFHDLPLKAALGQYLLLISGFQEQTVTDYK